MFKGMPVKFMVSSGTCGYWTCIQVWHSLMLAACVMKNCTGCVPRHNTHSLFSRLYG
jgi:hypothetical protein